MSNRRTLVNRGQTLVLIGSAFAGSVIAGLLFDSGPGIGLENLVGLIAGAIGGILITRHTGNDG